MASFPFSRWFVAAASLAAVASAHAQANPYTIDPTHSFVTFEASHNNISTLRGRFDRTEGSVLFDRQARSGKAQITIQTGSVSTGVPALDGKLRSADFFNVAAFGTSQFVGDSFVFDGDKLASVAGSLTLLGKTLPITLRARSFNCYHNPLLKREVCGGDFDTTITPSDWGLDHGVQSGWADRIHLLIQVEAIRQ